MSSTPLSTNRPRSRPLAKGLAAALSSLVILGAGPVANESTQLTRLRQMPSELRKALHENLVRFDSFSPESRQAIVEIDRALAEMSDVDRQRYLSVLRRYHVWLHAQPEATRQKIEALPPTQRLMFVEKERSEQSARREAARRKAAAFGDLIQVSGLVSEPLRISAIELRLWYRLEPEQRKKVLAPANAVLQQKKLMELVEKDEKLEAERRQLVQEFGLDLNELREAAARRAERNRPAMGKNGPVKQKLERAAEFNKFVRNANPAAVTARNIERFEDSMPPWVRDSMDALPPDAAIARLRILYRLVFPPPSELPEPKEQPKAGKSGPVVDPNARPF